MPRQMNTGTVFRQGRTRHVSAAEMEGRRQCCHNCILPCLAVFAFVVFPIGIWTKEDYFCRQQRAFDQVEDHVVPGFPVSHVRTGDLVSLSGVDYKSEVADPSFGVSIDHAIKISRHTQYCQWEQFTRTKCETCYRQKQGGKKESYKCNCVETYYYRKGWINRLVPSFHFDQPANHHNPQRDPYPSTNYVSPAVYAGEAGSSSGDNTYDILPEVSEVLRGVSRPVAWTWNQVPMPRTFFQKIFDWIFGAPVPTRWEDMRALSSVMQSQATVQHKFLYTNTQAGWFFSPYEAPTWQTVLRGFGQFLEGSMFDWQIGDIYDQFNGCTPGDIRVRFEVVDPRLISVIGEAQKSQRQGINLQIKAHNVHIAGKEDFAVRIMHAGVHSSSDMFSNETKEAYNAAFYSRFLCLFAGLGATYLMNKYLGMPTQDKFVISVVGLSLCILFGVWASVYGLSDWSGNDTSLSTVMTGGAGLLIFILSLSTQDRQKRL